MDTVLPSSADVIIIGGGIVGCSVAYHLAKLGCRDVILLERKQLTCGTTWHAAGLVPQLRATENMTRLAKYSQELYATLEQETGQATGYLQCGSLSIATTEDRLEEWRRGASTAKCFGVACEELSAEEAGRLWPLMETNDVLGAFFFPTDARTNPADTTYALAKGARQLGVRIIENVQVENVLVENERAVGVLTAHGEIKGKHVVNCTGMWALALGEKLGTPAPLYPSEHYYLITEPVTGVTRDLPVLRDYDRYTYYREETGKLMLGFFEPDAVPWGNGDIPDHFCFDDLPADWDRFAPHIEQALKRVPALEHVGLQLLFNGPESFTPDGRYLLGETPQVRNLFVAAGFNSVGIQSAGGAGMVLAEMIVNGRPPMDIWDLDINRMQSFQSDREYLRARTTESLCRFYKIHWPFEQFETARGIRTSALHERIAAQGACFGEVAGWERANWYAPEGVEPRYEYSFGRQNWFEHSAAEHLAVRNDVGLLDQSSFSKFLVDGSDAERVLNFVCANDVAVEPGKVVYTQWLNDRGTIEADLTVTRLTEDSYMIVTGPATHTHVETWLKGNSGDQGDFRVSNVTNEWSTLNVQGPKSRELLSSLTDADMSSSAFSFGTSQFIPIGPANVLALRISYVGELGWELYVPRDDALGVYDRLVEAGETFGLRHAGYHALNSLRMEKAYREFGHDIGADDTPLEAGIGFAVAFDKAGGFRGREALLKQRDTRLQKRLVQFLLEDPGPLMYHNEPIYRDGAMVGYTSAAMYGHTLGGSVALGYVHCPDGVTADFMNSGRYEIEVALERYPARASLKPLYDPKSERVRS